jgi:transposase
MYFTKQVEYHSQSDDIGRLTQYYRDTINMQIKLNATQIYIATAPVDFRKSAQGLSLVVMNQLNANLKDAIYIFYNHAKNKVKILGYHRNGMMLIYKILDKKKFTFKASNASVEIMTEKQLSWLLAGLDWVSMSENPELLFEDYF